MGEANGEDRELVQAVERHQQQQHRYRVRRRQNRGNRGRADERIAPVLGQLLARDDAGPLQDHQQDRQQERRAEAEQEAGDEGQIIADAGQRLLLDAPDIALIAEQEVQRPGHGEEVSEQAPPAKNRGVISRNGRKAFFSLA